MIYGRALKLAFILATSILVILFLSACGDYSAKTTPEPVTDDTGTTVAVSARCVEVSQEKLDEIASKLSVSGSVDLRAGWAVKSNDFDNLYFIAAEMEGPGFYTSEDIALWAAESLEPGQGSISSVNVRAKAHTTWPAAGDGITAKSDGASEVMQCVEVTVGK